MSIPTRHRIDERVLLAVPYYCGVSHAYAYVEDTVDRGIIEQEWTGKLVPAYPLVDFELADSEHRVHLAFNLDSADARDATLRQIDALADLLQRFRAALAAECELYAQREQELSRDTFWQRRRRRQLLRSR